MVSLVIGAIVGGALLGILWMLLTTPAVLAYRSNNGTQPTRRQITREAWVVAYVAGVLTYILLRASGVITY